jgi:hypothetical protein
MLIKVIHTFIQCWQGELGALHLHLHLSLTLTLTLYLPL